MAQRRAIVGAVLAVIVPACSARPGPVPVSFQEALPLARAGTIEPSAIPQSPIFVTNISAGGGRRVLVFNAADSGNVAPVRQLKVRAAAFAAGTDGSFWDGPIWQVTYRIENRNWENQLLGTIGKRPGIAGATLDRFQRVDTLEGYESYGVADCSLETPVVRQYPRNGYRSVPVTLLVPAAKHFPQINCTSQLSVGSDDSIFIATNQVTNGYWVGAAIRQYSLSKRHLVRETVFGTKGGAQEVVGGISADRSDNVYALLNSSLVEYRSGSSKAVPILSNYAVVAFALDARSNVFAIVRDANDGFSIAFFPAGASSPTTIVSGSRTNLTNPVAIAVAR